MHAGLITRKGMCLGSRDLCQFWEISVNISDTVRDRNTAEIEPT